MDVVDDAVFVPSAASGMLQGGFVNPFTGDSGGRVYVGSGFQGKVVGRIRPRSSGANNQGPGRVKEIQRRIAELERSAMAMYSQVGCARHLPLNERPIFRSFLTLSKMVNTH